jgi:poly-beta-1,6-N-acetyl-D-glucosamine biosynthesis protein PgaD
MKNIYPNIIETSKSLPFLLLLRDVILTALCWLLFLYFLRDAFGFFMDVALWAINGFVGAEAYDSFRIVDTIILYVEIIVVMNAVYIGWAIYNNVRFGKETRRRASPAVTADEIASRLRVNPREMESWRKAKILVIHHDKEGRVTSIAKG